MRFIKLGHGSWDQHSNIQTALANNCSETDIPIAGLLTDHKRRDFLKDTLILRGGEFGRTPYSDSGSGRDHNHKGDFQYGRTDEHGYEAIENKMHIHDWHTTVLHQQGLDHEQLNYRYAGREMRLTKVAGSVANDILF